MKFDKESKSDLCIIIFFLGGGGGGGGWGCVLKPKQYARLSNELNIKSNHLHNEEHVVQSTFQNMLITFVAQTYNSNFEFCRKVNF